MEDNRSIEPVDSISPARPVPPRPVDEQSISKREKPKNFQESLDKAIQERLKSKIDKKA
jgi:hypothetical protein